MMKRMLTMAAYTSVVTKLARSADVPDDVDRKTHHVKSKTGETIRFRNPHPSSGPEPLAAYQMVVKMGRARFHGKLTQPDTADTKIPTVTPTLLTSRDGSSSLRATWLGHACYFVEFPSGLRVLFDPVFEDRCSPSQFLGPKRYSPPACALSDLPAVDAVVISHSHYDHLSCPSVTQIAKQHPHAQFFVGLGLARWFRASGIDRVTELDWWEDAELSLSKTSDDKAPDAIKAEISCLPCQHSSGRTGLDKDHTLWASWAVKSEGRSVWFGGDTGYRHVPELAEGVDDYGDELKDLPRCPDFKEIGRRRGPFDLGLIPIGAYKPRFLFSDLHANPFDAVEIFKDTRCERAMGIHWGTWVLTMEEPEEPPRLLREALRRAGIAETGVFDTCAVGETREF